MIRFRDAAILAGTKLRTRKTRTIVTAVLASLLFAALVFAFTVTKGAVDSYARYSKNGLSNRYITSVIYNQTEWIDTSSPELIVRAKERNKQVVTEKKADAKRLGIEYDAANEPTVTMTDGQGSPEYLNTENFAVQQIMAEEKAQQKTNEQRIQEITAGYHATGFYGGKSFGDTNNLKTMKAGKESFESSTQQSFSFTTDSLATLSYLPQTIVNSFLLDGADLTPATTTDSQIPVIVTYGDAEKALGLQSLPKTATSAERLQRIEDVKKQAVNLTISVCYRNGASNELIEKTKLQIADIEKHKNDAAYQKPSEIYALPDVTSCGPVVVVKDTRTAEEKRLAAKQKEFNLKYNLETEPVQKKLVFRIIGLSANIPDYAGMGSFENLAFLVGGTSLVGQWAIPSELVDASIQENFISKQTDDTMSSYMTTANLVEFSSAADAKKFVSEQACTGMDCMTKPNISYFGSNSVLLENIVDGLAQALLIAGLIVSVIAAVLMMGMVGRVITDSRRETAVFRAIGAKRNDIRLMYTLYVLTFSLIIAAIAVSIGFALASAYNASVVDSLTTSARLMFIETRETAAFTIVGVWPEALVLTVGVIVLTGFVSMLLPLARNLARSPLKDMRDE